MLSKISGVQWGADVDIFALIGINESNEVEILAINFFFFLGKILAIKEC